MKKYITMLLALVFSATLIVDSYAQTLTLNYDGIIHNVETKICKLKINGELISTDVPPIILSGRTLVPAGAVFKKLGATVKWDGKGQKVSIDAKGTRIVLKINDKTAVVDDRKMAMDVPAKIINDRTMIPVSFVSTQLGMKVNWSATDYLVSITSANPASFNLNNIEYAPKGTYDQIILTLDKMMSNYDIFQLQDPSRIVVDLPNTNVRLDQKINVKSKQIKAVRYAQYEGNTARVVLDMSGLSQYKVEKQNNKLVLNLRATGTANRGDDEPDRGAPVTENTPVQEKPAPTVVPTVTLKPTPKPSPVITPKTTHTVTPTTTPETKPTPVNTVTPDITTIPSTGELTIDYSSGNNQVIIRTANYKGYGISRLTDPNRFVIDIPGTSAQADQRTISVNSSLIKTIRYARYDQTTTRVVLDINGLPGYHVEEGDGQLILTLDPPTYKNIKYYNNADRVGFLLQGAKLTEGDSKLRKLYEESYDPTGTQYTITFPGTLANIGSGTIQMNDDYLKSVDIKTNSSSGKTSITFNAADRYVYEIIARSSENDTAITILKPAAKGERLVVIDPGHGGSEPGAESGGILEKDINLSISLKVNALLKSKNIKTYIMREDDSFVGLYERAYIANDLNATLFLCIHNNAYYASYKGTETLYSPNSPNSPSGFSSKRFAQNTQNNLVNALGTNNRGIVERPNLVVLKATSMPAILAEIAFMTNKDEFARLQSESFQNKAAQALCDSVIQALNEN